MTHESFVSADDVNMVVTSLTFNGTNCGTVNVTAQAGFLQGHFGPTHASVVVGGNVGAGRSSNGSSATNATYLLVGRDSVSTTHNTLTASYCGNSGQHSGSQRWAVAPPAARNTGGGARTTSPLGNGVTFALSNASSVSLADGRCIRTVSVDGGGGSPTTKITITGSACLLYTSPSPRDRG